MYYCSECGDGPLLFLGLCSSCASDECDMEDVKAETANDLAKEGG